VSALTDIAGNTSTTASVSVGSVTSNAIEIVGDHDWFKVTLSAGQTITVTAAGGGGLDTYLNIYDPTGTTILASNDDIVDGVNQDSRITFTASSAGTYFIDVSAFQNSTQSSTGTYDLFVEPSPAPVFTYDQIAFQLTNGYWGGDVHHWPVTQGQSLTVNISTLSAAEQTLARAALQEWTDIIGVKFQEVSTGGQIVFSDAEDTTAKGPVAQTDANWDSNGIISSAHIQISQSWVTNYGTSLDSYSFQSYVHEIGHALGLGHGGEYNNTATYSTDALYANDDWATTIMSYFDQQENTYFANKGFTREWVLTPMDADVLAMQSLYGLSTTTRTANTTYGYHASAETAGGIFDAAAYPKAAFAIFDSGGTDTIDYSGYSGSQLINLNPETFSNVNGYVGNLTIDRGTVIENAIGGSGPDTIIGNSANNVLTGNLGADILTGGGGNDTFLDTKAGHNGDTITDFHAGDQIIFADATLGSFTFSLSGNTLTYTGGSMTLNGSFKGTFTAVTASTGGVDLTFASSAARLVGVSHNDFNGDGRSDALWVNTNGTLVEWLGQSNGAFADNSANFLINPGTAWHVAATGDFNGDGRADLLWSNDNGTTVDWLGQPSGGFADNSAVFLSNPGTSWHIVGTADFNGDGRDDILWRNDNGTVLNWLATASGGFADNSVNFVANPGASWHVAATGDFNGDGLADILWRNDNGMVVDWLGQSSGTFTDNSVHSLANPGTAWHIVGSGDFNGDGIADLLWRNDNGTVVDWLGQSNGGFADNSAHFLVNPGSSWHVVEIADVNGDSNADLVWQNTNGTVLDWLGQLNGGFVDNGPNSLVSPGSQWHVIDPSVHDPFA
jgi:hypothetical protein